MRPQITGPGSPAAPGSPGEIAGLGPVAFGIVTAILPVFLLGSLSIEIRAELDYGEATGGLILAVFFAASAVVSSRIGRGIDRIGPRRGLLAALGGIVVLQLLIAGAGRHPWVLAVLAAASGICNATAQLSANVFIARDLPLHRQGVGFAVKQSAMPGASLVAGLTLPAIALTLGWRWVFVLGAALAAGAMALVALRLPGRGATSRTPPGAPAGGYGADTSAPGDAGPAPPRGALAALAVAAAFSTAAAITLGGFFVESAIDAGITAAVAGLAFAGGSLVSIVVRLAGRHARRPTPGQPAGGRGGDDRVGCAGLGVVHLAIADRAADRRPARLRCRVGLAGAVQPVGGPGVAGLAGQGHRHHPDGHLRRRSGRADPVRHGCAVRGVRRRVVAGCRPGALRVRSGAGRTIGAAARADPGQTAATVDRRCAAD